MQTLTSLSPLGATCMELEARQGTSLTLPSAGEPLNPMLTCKGELNSVHIGEGKHDFDGEAAIGRIPVISANGTPLMACNPAKARKLLRDDKAVKKWSKLGIFCIQLTFNPEQLKSQLIAVGVDSGSKFEGMSVVGTSDTVLNIMSEATSWVKRALKQRRQMRKARRYRNTRRRECRFDNRLSGKNWLSPSTKARWDAKLRIISQLKRIMPISKVVVEDIRAKTRKGSKKWNTNFSPLEVGKQYFYSKLRGMGMEVLLKSGMETKELRKQYGLKKISNKSKSVFESHCVDLWCLAASITGAKHPTTKSMHYMVPLRFNRRQLHMLQFSRGGIRRRQGGTLSLGLKKGTLVGHIKYGLCFLGGNMRNKFSLHSLADGKRITQQAKREDFKILTRIAFRTRFLPPINEVGILGGF